MSTDSQSAVAESVPVSLNGCGPQCVYLSLRMLGVSSDQLRQASIDYTPDQGTTLENLKTMLAEYETESEIAYLHPKELCFQSTPSILLVERAVARGSGPRHHFVVGLGQTLDGRLAILDPSRGVSEVPLDSFVQQWTGAGLFIPRAQGGLTPSYSVSVALGLIVGLILGRWLLRLASSTRSRLRTRSSVC